ncbi:sugar transferase [Mycobacterium sp. AT1]|uniref:sugar transferase n=1 Tax=Mycobacterium sp. AT1 TaxID=1961706 RepID=UPI0009AC31C8|nr:sugar transferase [Mycobacterium sp. AT1]OPX09183.1 UDP-phosphate galactose phosphotransferase [Mycobacterium sp. AT1]
MITLQGRNTSRTTAARQGRRRRRTLDELARANPLSTIITVSIDVFAGSAGVALGAWWALSTEPTSPPVWICTLYTPLIVGTLAFRKAYARRLNRRFLDEIGPVLAATALAAVFLLSLMEFVNAPGHIGGMVAKIWVSVLALMLLCRLIRATYQRSLRRRNLLLSPVIVVGNGRVANQIVERLRSSPQHGLSVIGLLDAEPPWAGTDSDGDMEPIPYLGTPDDVDRVIRETGAEGIVVAFSLTQDQLLTPVVRIAHRHGLRVWVVPRMFDSVGENIRVEHVGGLPLLAVPHTDPQGWQFTLGKHVGDRVLAGFGLLLISPIFLTLMLLVRISSPGPVFFRQPRVGRDGHVFDCLKFRSMRAAPPSGTGFELVAGHAPGGVEGVDRRTKIGKIMRRTSLDELPQLLNVIKGDMSLVGPRPERPEFVALFDAQIRRYGERHRVKAGVTGWAQVHGLRGQTSIADRAEWDNYYIENWSWALDMKILLLTVLAVMHRAE